MRAARRSGHPLKAPRLTLPQSPQPWEAGQAEQDFSKAARGEGVHRLLTDCPDDVAGAELAFELEVPIVSAAFVDMTEEVSGSACCFEANTLLRPTNCLKLSENKA